MAREDGYFPKESVGLTPLPKAGRRAGVLGETIHSGARLPLPELCAQAGGCLVPSNEQITMHGRLRLHTHYTCFNFNIPGS